MALEHGPRIEFVEIGENGSFHPEEVGITPPARRKKKEGKKYKDNKSMPNPAKVGEDKTTNTDSVAEVHRSPAVSAALSVNEAGTVDMKPNEDELSAHGESTVNDELRHEECETFVESVLHEEVHGNAVTCKATSFENYSVRNSFVDEGDLVASAIATDFSLNTSEKGFNEDAEKKGNSVVQRQTCVSPDITSGGQTSQDEESFFSADSEAETSSELKTSACREGLNEMLRSSTNSQDSPPTSHECSDISTEREAAFDIAHSKESLPESSSEACTGVMSCQTLATEDPITQALNKTARALEIIENLQDSTKEFSCIGTETAWHGVTDTPSYSCQGSELSLKDVELGAIGGEKIYETESDEDWSLSSSCTSSEGEYDIMWAEEVRGVKGQNVDNGDILPEDPVFEILSVFSSTELVSVAVDSEDDSNKGESLGSSVKSTNDVQSSPSPLLNIIDDQDDASSTGEEILACFPPSECPVVVDNSSFHTTENVTKSELVENAGESEVSLSEAEEKACSNNKMLIEVSGQISKPSVIPDISCDSQDNAVDLSEVGSFPKLSEKVDTSTLMDSTNSVRGSGSLRLVNNNGVLKIIDCSQTPVTKENVKEARILRNTSLKDKVSLSGQGTEDLQIDSNSASAAQLLSKTVSEVRKMDEDVEDGVQREIHNVCEDIARLESFSKRDDELNFWGCELQDSAPSEDSHNLSGELNASGNSEGLVDIGHSDTVVISVGNTTDVDQRPLLEAKGTPVDETNDKLVRERGNTAASNSSTLSRSDGQINESVDETVRKSATVREKKQRPKRLARFKRYSLDTESALMSPEDEVHAELTKFGSSTSLDDQSPPLVTTASETETSATAEMVTDGQRDETHSTPSPPPRSHSSKLKYSASFSAAAAPGRLLAPKEEKRSKRGRSDRWKTLPNNTFDLQADKWSFARLGAALKLSSAPAETDEVPHQLPLTLITDEMAATFPNFPQERRAQIALELYTTERSYVRGLETIIQLFKKPCEERKLLDKKESEAIFHNIEDIYRVNKDVLFNLLERIKHWHDQQCMGDIFVDQGLKIFDRMKIYAKFCNNYDSAETLYKQKLKRSKEFEAFLNACYEHTVCQPGLNLPAYLITVVQRIPRYLLLLRDLLERTPENHADHSNLTKALGKMNHLAVYINNQLETVVGLKAMDELRLRVIGLKALEGRALIKEADVTLNGLKKTRQCLLFNDMLVFAAKGVSKTSEVEQTVDVTTLWCMDLEGNNPQSTKEDSLEIFTPEKSYIIYVGTKTEKKVWLQKLRTAIAMALHGSEATDKDEIESRKSKFTYKDGRTYWGNFVSGKRHGQGVLSWPNQTRYQGHWEDNDRNGQGDLTYNNGDKYSGHWLDDKQHGFGRMEYTTGDAYCGEWYQGDMHGLGEIRFKNGDWFKGEFHHNEVDGEGELNCVSGLLYKGTWKHSKKHGKGRMQFSNGDNYIGEFVNDRISGQGEMMYADGSVYKGSWINNQRHGTGELTCPDGSHYLGGWIGDDITGKGCMTYSNGDYYDGVWFKNLRFGQGLMKYSNGNSYEGGFVYDLCNNHGAMRYKDGSEYVGNWSNGLRDGRGKMRYANGSIYEGDWMNGMRHGEGTLTFANRASYSGRWELDKQHGRGMYEDKSTGYHFEGEWQDGRKAGRGVERTSEGLYEGEWKDNMRHGQGTEELSCGTKFEGGWKENRKHGSGRKILKTGMTEAQVWQDGHLVEMSNIILIELPLIQRR